MLWSAGLNGWAALFALPGVLLASFFLKCQCAVRPYLVPSLISGITAEILFSQLGWIHWKSDMAGLPPLELCALWANMALLWDRLFKDYPLVLIYPAMGIGAPFAYWGGHKMGLVSMQSDYGAAIGIGTIYILVTFLCYRYYSSHKLKSRLKED